MNAGWPYHASKQARMYEHDQVTLIRHVDANVHREKIHQECTPGHVYVVSVSIIQHARTTPRADATPVIIIPHG